MASEAPEFLLDIPKRERKGASISWDAGVLAELDAYAKEKNLDRSDLTNRLVAFGLQCARAADARRTTPAPRRKAG